MNDLTSFGATSSPPKYRNNANVFYGLTNRANRLNVIEIYESGDFNLSKIDGEILYKRKVFFKQEQTDKLLSSIETFAKDERVLNTNHGLPS